MSPRNRAELATLEADLRLYVASLRAWPAPVLVSAPVLARLRELRGKPRGAPVSLVLPTAKGTRSVPLVEYQQ